MRILKAWQTIKPLLPVLLFITMTSCSSFEEIDVGEIEDVRLRRIGGRNIEFDVTMPIENPSALRFRITDVDLDVYINNEYIGKIKNVDHVLIPANSEDLYVFPLSVEFSGILQGALSMFSFFLERQTEVEVRGNIKARSFPFTRNIPVEEKSMLRMR